MRVDGRNLEREHKYTTSETEETQTPSQVLESCTPQKKNGINYLTKTKWKMIVLIKKIEEEMLVFSIPNAMQRLSPQWLLH